MAGGIFMPCPAIFCLGLRTSCRNPDLIAGLNKSMLERGTPFWTEHLRLKKER